jgi:hypothetical protein
VVSFCGQAAILSSILWSDGPDGQELQGNRRKRRRREDDDDGIEVCLGHQIIPTKHLKLTREIGSGPGYFIHAGENKGRAVIVKVFNAGPNVREVRRVIGRNSISRLTLDEAIVFYRGSVKGTYVSENLCTRCIY